NSSHLFHGCVDVGDNRITCGGGDNQRQNRGTVDLNTGGEGNAGGIVGGGDSLRPLRHQSAVLVQCQGHVSGVSGGHGSTHVDLVITVLPQVNVGSIELDGAAAAGAAKPMYGSARVDGSAAGDGLRSVISDKSKSLAHDKTPFK